MSISAPNIEFSRHDVILNKSPLPYNDRRRYGNRLKRLYDHLASLKPSRYDHSSIVTQYATKAPACGTTACAFGHAVVSGKFKGLHVKFKLKARATPDSKGYIWDEDLDYVVDTAALNRELKKLGLEVTSDKFSTAADAYFGPGAWKAIFDTMPYEFTSSTPKATVMRRIKDVAEKVYGVKIPRPSKAA